MDPLARARLLHDVASFEIDGDAWEVAARAIDAQQDAVLALFSDPSAEARALACEATAELAGAGDWEDVDRGVRASMSRLGADARPLVRALLADSDSKVRLAALRAVAAHRDREAAPALRALENDPDLEDTLIDAWWAIDRASVTPLLRRRLRARGATATLARYARASTLEAGEVRDLLVPALASADTPLRAQAALALVEHADGSCKEALAALVPAGDSASMAAMVALARLGRDAPAEEFARWFGPHDELLLTAGWATAVCEGFEVTEPLVACLARIPRLPFGAVNRTGWPLPSQIMRIVSAIDHPSVPDAVAPFFRLPVGVEPSAGQHAASWDHWQRVTEIGYACMALGTSRAGVDRIQEVRRQSSGRVRLFADLGLALFDPEALDQHDASDEGWPRRVDTFEPQWLALALALRRIGRRTSGAPRAAGTRALVDAALRAIARADVEEALRAARDGSGFSLAWAFAIRDLFAEIRATFV